MNVRRKERDCVPKRALLWSLGCYEANTIDFSNCCNCFSGAWFETFIQVFWTREESLSIFSCCLLFIAGVKCSQNIVSHLQLETKNVKYSCCSNRLVRKRGLSWGYSKLCSEMNEILCHMAIQNVPATHSLIQLFMDGHRLGMLGYISISSGCQLISFFFF